MFTKRDPPREKIIAMEVELVNRQAAGGSAEEADRSRPAENIYVKISLHKIR